AKLPPKRGVYDRTTRGMRIYLATPRLRGLLAVNLVAASASAMVIVNTVVLVQGQLKLTQNATALALACFPFVEADGLHRRAGLAGQLPDFHVNSGASCYDLQAYAKSYGRTSPMVRVGIVSPQRAVGPRRQRPPILRSSLRLSRCCSLR
ncbi:MAG: hypothetical protein V4532_07290, partial [Pseudomonadota bacterium]